MARGCFVSTGRSLQSAIDRVRLAESLGYETVYVTHIAGRESLTVLTAYALSTTSIRVGTGVVPIYTRTPATMAQTAATIDELSGGRLTLGLGLSHRPVVEGWHGQKIEHPVAEMREYAGIVRAILRGEDPPRGEKWQTGFHLLGLDPRPQLPIYLAGLSPGMLRLAGEIADGVILWLCNPRYIRDVVIPAVGAGRERAGLTLEGFDVVAAIPAALTDDRDDGLPSGAQRPDPVLQPAVLPGDDRAHRVRRRHRRLRSRRRRSRGDAERDLRAVPRRAHRGRRSLGADGGHRALPRRRGELALHRPDPRHGLRGHAARRRALNSASDMAPRAARRAAGGAARAGGALAGAANINRG